MKDNLETQPVESCDILGIHVDATSYSHATSTVIEMAQKKISGYISIANVHVIMEGHHSAEFKAVLDKADLITPDGMPLVWMMQKLGYDNQARVYGPTLMLHVCEAASKKELPVGFLGATPDVASKLVSNLKSRFGNLKIAFTHSPPFRPLSDEEQKAIVRDICRSGARVLFVGLGCPKQENWMAVNTGQIPAVMLGVGAAFDFHAGTLPQAPPLLQRLGLEWLFRLSMEPKRLWRRYLVNNPKFMTLALKQLVQNKQR